jgi:putative membrane protein
VQDQNAGKLSTIKTYLLVAFIFNLLAVIGFAIATLVFLIFIVGIIFIIPLVIAILILSRTMSMRSAAERGDIAKLKELNSIGWAILALILAGTINGIMLILAYGAINDLVPPNASMTQSAQYSPASGQAMGDYKYCASCGNKIAKSAGFCPVCGAAQK